MEPQQPQQPGRDPLFHAPFEQPPETSGGVVASSAPNPEMPESGPPKSKLPLIIGGAAVGLLLLIALIAIVASSGSPKTKTTTGSKTDSTQVEGPKAANSSSLQLIDDSISQDASSLNDDKDFRANKFEDRSLNL